MAVQKVALVVGASRGIGRQVAIDLAKNGYAGENIQTLYTTHWIARFVLSEIIRSCGGRKIDQRCVQGYSFPAAPQFPTVDYQYSRTGNQGSWRRSYSNSCRRPGL